MKKFLKHIAYGLFFFVLINLLIVLKYEYPAYQAIKNKTHKNYLKWNSIHTNKNTYDLIILGSSRCYTGFNPKVIDSGLNIESFNGSHVIILFLTDLLVELIFIHINILLLIAKILNFKFLVFFESI